MHDAHNTTQFGQFVMNHAVCIMYRDKNGLVAQLVEHGIRIAGVRGSNPLESTVSCS